MVRQLWPNKLITFCSEIPGILTEPAMACRSPPSSGTDLTPAFGPPGLHPPRIWACAWTPLGNRLLAVVPSYVLTFCKLEELYHAGGRRALVGEEQCRGSRCDKAGMEERCGGQSWCLSLHPRSGHEIQCLFVLGREGYSAPAFRTLTPPASHFRFAFYLLLSTNFAKACVHAA